MASRTGQWAPWGVEVELAVRQDWEFWTVTLRSTLLDSSDPHGPAWVANRCDAAAASLRLNQCVGQKYFWLLFVCS